MSEQTIFTQSSIMTIIDDSELMKLKTELEQLRARVEVLQFSESVQKAKVLRLTAKQQSLVEENEAMRLKLSAENEELVKSRKEKEIRYLSTDIFTLCINVLQIGQNILERQNPNDNSVYVKAHGDVLRKMFEFCFTNQSYDFLDGFESLQFKVYCGMTQFAKFAEAFAIFIYSSDMVIPGTNLQVTAIRLPKLDRRFNTADESRIYECIKFEVPIYCRDTKKQFKIVFSCDAGWTLPFPNFDVNCLSLSIKHGFEACVQANYVSVVDIFRCIIDRKAQWFPNSECHLSSIADILQLWGTAQYKQFGSPHLRSYKFCPFLQDRSICLEYSGCDCTKEVNVSLSMMKNVFEMSKVTGQPLLCPFCKKQLNMLTYEINREGLSAFDVSCIDQVPTEDAIKKQQEDFQTVVSIFGEEEKDDSEIPELIAGFSELAAVRGRKSSKPIFQIFRIPPESQHLFFPVEQDDEDDEDNEDDHDYQVDEDNQDFQDDHGYQLDDDDEDNQDIQDIQDDHGYQLDDDNEDNQDIQDIQDANG